MQESSSSELPVGHEHQSRSGRVRMPCPVLTAPGARQQQQSRLLQCGTEKGESLDCLPADWMYQGRRRSSCPRESALWWHCVDSHSSSWRGGHNRPKRPINSGPQIRPLTKHQMQERRRSLTVTIMLRKQSSQTGLN